jgi:integrase
MRQRKPFYWKFAKAWYVQLDGKRIPLGGKGRPGKHPPAEVWDAYNEIMADRLPTTADGPVANLVRKFLAFVETDRPKCLKWYSMFLRSFVAHIGENLTLANLETHHIDDWISTRYAGKSSSCRAGAVRAIGRVFNWAFKKGHYKGANPAKAAERPAVKPRGNEAYLSPEQIDKILSVIDETDPFKQLVYAMLYTGCRPQEARLVEVRHVKSDSWLFPVDESKCGEKTQRERVVYLNADALAVTQRALLRAGGSGRLFRNRKDKPFTTAWINSKFRRISKKVKFRVTAYYLRHTWITTALLNDVSPQKVAALAGHSVAMTQNIYNHLHLNRGAMKDALRQATGQASSGKIGGVA